jgi:HlyD family secretion protein
MKAGSGVKKWIIIGVVILLIAMIAVNLAKRGGQAIEVEMADVETRTLVETVKASGVLTPKRKVDVSAETIGKITTLAVAEGDKVEAGQLLMEIDPAEYASVVEALEASVNTADADLKLARVTAEKAVHDLERSESLFENNLIADQQVDDARTSALVEAARVDAAVARQQQAHANLQKARHDLKKVTISAPMAGVVTRLNVEEGENAIMGTLNNPGTVLLEIADLSTMETEINVDETEVVDVLLGQAADVEIDAFPDQVFAGEVTEIGNSPIYTSTGLNQQAVDFKVTVTLLDAIRGVRPGLSSEATITVARRDSAVALPIGAVIVREWPIDDPDTEGEDTEGVFIVSEGKAEFRPVKLGITGEDDFEVISGLEPGETIITGPFRTLRDLEDGDQVKEKKKTGRRD